MAHKTLISGTGYDVSGGRELIGGTGYAKKKGRVLVNGTGYDIPFSSGIPIGTLPVGSVVKIGVNGKSYDFLVVNQGIPSGSSLYDSSCDGTWMLMKDCYEMMMFNESKSNVYNATTPIQSYLNSTFMNTIDSNVRDAIKQVIIPYRKGNGQYGSDANGADGLPCKVFLLSGGEVGLNQEYYMPNEGAKLSYFVAGGGGNSKRIAYLNGDAVIWWLRSPYRRDRIAVFCIAGNGDYSNALANSYRGCRPAFTLPGTFSVIQNSDGTYSPAA